MPSALYRDLYWRVTIGDIRTKLRLYVAEKQYGYIQDFETIARIISMALGGKEKEEEIPIPKTKGEAAMMVASIFKRT